MVSSNERDALLTMGHLCHCLPPTPTHNPQREGGWWWWWWEETCCWSGTRRLKCGASLSKRCDKRNIKSYDWSQLTHAHTHAHTHTTSWVCVMDPHVTERYMRSNWWEIRSHGTCVCILEGTPRHDLTVFFKINYTSFYWNRFTLLRGLERDTC